MPACKDITYVLDKLSWMRAERIWPNGQRYTWTDAFGVVLLVSLYAELGKLRDDCKSEAVKDQVLCGTLKAWQHFPRLQRRSARREGSRWRTRVTHQGGGMISVSDRQLRIVAAAADLLPVEARGTFLRCVVAELRGRGDFSDCDVERVVRATLLDQSAARCA